MLINSEHRYLSWAGYDLMSNTPVVIQAARDRMVEVAKQAQALASGLQSVAPAELSASSPNTTVQYLFEISDQLQAYAKECDLLLK